MRRNKSQGFRIFGLEGADLGPDLSSGIIPILVVAQVERHLLNKHLDDGPRQYIQVGGVSI